MPSKKSAPDAPAAKKTESGIPLGRPAFPANALPNTADAARPAGAVEMQVPKGQETQKPGASTLTIMNPNPSTAAADSTSTSKSKRG